MITTARNAADRLDSRDRRPDGAAPGTAAGVRPAAWQRWLPFAAAGAVVIIALLAAQTPVGDLARFAAYGILAVLLPGTLLYRALRRHPHTLAEDLAMGAAVGLTLEVAAWALFSALDLRAWVWVWPLAVLGPFLVVPRWRRHWWVRDYTPAPLGWSWALAGIVAVFVTYLYAVFLARNPLVPPDEEVWQYEDLAYHLSLASEMTRHFPPNLPQVAGEPLYYHWFSHVHMAMAAMIGQVELPVAVLRLAVPGLSILAICLSAVAAWRISGRPYVGAGAAVLFWTIGEVHFAHPVQIPFGTQVGFVVWHGVSMVYSWVLLFALMAVLVDVVRGSAVDARAGAAASRNGGTAVPAIGSGGAYALVALLALGSGGAKATSLPVVLAALGLTALVLLIGHRRLPGPVIAVTAIVIAAALVSIAVLFRFDPHTLKLDVFGRHALAPYWTQPPKPRPEWLQWLVMAGVWVAFLINMQLRAAGIVPLLWLRRMRLQLVEWFLLGGALAGPVLYLCFASYDARYFTRTGFAFGVILSAWGYALVCDRARLTRRAAIGLGAGAAVFAAALVAAQLLFAGPIVPATEQNRHIRWIMPILQWAAILTITGLVSAGVWRVLRPYCPALRGRGAIATLTAILVAGAPGLVMDASLSLHHPNDGPYTNVRLPRSRVEAAQWVRDNSRPDDVLATNVHCRDGRPGPHCNPRTFWLSAYAERSVLVEGWGYSHRLARLRAEGRQLPFWDPALLRFNDEAFTAPTRANLGELRRRYGVRWLVVDRTAEHESAVLGSLAIRRFDNGRMAVYELPPDADGG